MTKRISQPNTVVVPAVHADGVDGKVVATKTVVVPAEAEVTSAKADATEAKADEAPVTVVAEPVAALVAPAPMAMVADQDTAADPAMASASTAQESDDGGTDLTPYIVGGVLVLGGVLAVALSSGDTDPIPVTPAPTNTAPNFTSAATATIAENASPATVVYDANASDTQGNAIVFAIGGTDAALFNFDTATGVVTLKASANFEAKSSYSFTVTATDNGSPPASATQTVTVTVTNVNEQPTFASATATATVAENIPTSTVVFTAAATDPDAIAGATTPPAGSVVTYTITGTDAAAFNINATNGQVTFKASPDFETKSSYTFTVTATDNATPTLSSSQTVTVNVTDVAETPNVAPVFTSGTTATIAENAAATTVFYDANATDTAGQTVRFTLGGTDAGLLSIDATTGIVTLNAPANFEAKPTYSFTVTATDNGNPAASVTQTITGTITNVNEAPTFAAATQAISFAENGTGTVLTATATDPDGTVAPNTLAYTLTGADAALFSVSTAGVVTFRAAPDFETPRSAASSNVYSFNVVATDQGGLTTTQAETVTVTDIAVEGVRIDGAGIPATTNANYDAAVGNVTYLESGAVGNISTINNFTSGDIIQTDVATSSYSFGSIGTTLVISFNNNGTSTQISLPGAAGNAFIFNEASAEQAVGFDFFRSTVAGPPTPPPAAGTLAGTATYDATNAAVTYTDDAAAPNVSRITNFTTDDRIVVTGTPAGSTYSFSSIGSDLTISFNNNGVSSQIVLVGAVSPSAFIFDETSAERAVGSDFFRYG